MSEEMREKRKLQDGSLGDKLHKILENTFGETTAAAAKRVIQQTTEAAFDQAAEKVAGEDPSHLTQGLLSGLKTSLLGTPEPAKPVTLKVKLLRQLNKVRKFLDS